jgi:2-polyprenyl-3-methyl-5-hydroxy-6-metoxy-1,4-benzoquinol methylase
MENINQYYRERSNYKIGGGRLRHILELLPPPPQTILDVGCGAGDLARELKEKGYVVDGLDVSDSAIGEATPYLRRGYVADLSSNVLPDDLKGKRYDLIIASEVLEHTFAPEEVLMRLASLLNENGRVLITVPNFLFWKVRLQVLRGEFRYEKRGGLLDYGHIRFFTYQYAKEVFSLSGFEIEKNHHFYPNLYERGLTRLGNIFPSLFAYQFIFLLKRGK